MKKYILIFSTFLVFGCSKHEGANNNERNFFDGFYRDDSYGGTYERMSQTRLLQGGFENYFEAIITYWNSELRKSFVREMARAYRMTDAETQLLESEELKEDDRYFTFIVSASSREDRWRDLDGSNSLWRLSLENTDGSVRVRPDRIELVSVKDDRWKFFYRSMNRFNKTFRIRFLKKDLESSSHLHLHISGPLGGVSTKFQTSVVDPNR